jgi:hypothetical protein
MGRATSMLFVSLAELFPPFIHLILPLARFLLPINPKSENSTSTTLAKFPSPLYRSLPLSSLMRV